MHTAEDEKNPFKKITGEVSTMKACIGEIEDSIALFNEAEGAFRSACRNREEIQKKQKALGDKKRLMRHSVLIISLWIVASWLFISPYIANWLLADREELTGPQTMFLAGSVMLLVATVGVVLLYAIIRLYCWQRKKALGKRLSKEAQAALSAGENCKTAYRALREAYPNVFPQLQL